MILSSLTVHSQFVLSLLAAEITLIYQSPGAIVIW